MALVDYPSSDEDGEEEPLPSTETPNLKRKHDEDSSSALPPLPSKFLDLYASNARVSTKDDPSLHGGRKRVTPHVEGNWPTHLYIEWYPGTTEYGSLTKLISKLEDSIPSEKAGNINTFLTSDLGTPLPLHISLSRPIGFPTEKKDAFVTSLEQVIKVSGVRPFNVAFSGIDWVPNFQKTRWFLVLRLQKSDSNVLNKLLYLSNEVVQDYGQPPLYVQESKHNGQHKTRRGSETRIDWNDIQEVSDAFHISIAWALEKPSFQLLAATKSVVVDDVEVIGGMIAFGVEEIKAKVGNIITNIRLPREVRQEKALWGE